MKIEKQIGAQLRRTRAHAHFCRTVFQKCRVLVSILAGPRCLLKTTCTTDSASDATRGTACDSPSSQTREKKRNQVEFCKHFRKLLLHEEKAEAGGVPSKYTVFVRHARGCGRMAVVVGVSTSGGGS